MSEQVNTVNEEMKRHRNKKMLLWAILIVVVVIVVYVLFGDEYKEYRLNTEARDALPSVTNSDSSSVLSATSYSSEVTPLSSSSSLNIDGSSASEVRKELANLFRSYA